MNVGALLLDDIPNRQYNVFQSTEYPLYMNVGGCSVGLDAYKISQLYIISTYYKL